VSVRTHLGVDEKPIEDAKALSQCVVIGGHWSWEENERCVTIRLRQVA
jgi:hypothetical protein